MKTYKVQCQDKIHRVGVDDEGCIHLLDHDIEEEETNYSLGGDCSRCFAVLKAVEQLDEGRFSNAVAEGDLDIVRLYLDAGFDIDYADGYTVHLAIIHSNSDIVEHLIKCGVDVNGSFGVIDINGSKKPLSHLSLARRCGDERIAKLLEDAGAKE